MAEVKKEQKELKVPAFMRKKRRKSAGGTTKIKAKAKKASTRAKRDFLKSLPSKPKAVKAKKAARKKSSRKTKARPSKTLKKKGNPAGRDPLKPSALKNSQLPIAVVTNYLDQIQVAILFVKSEIKVGQKVQFRGLNDFQQTIDSMQYNHKEIQKAPAGLEIGLKVKKDLKTGDKVFR